MIAKSDLYSNIVMFILHLQTVNIFCKESYNCFVGSQKDSLSYEEGNSPDRAMRLKECVFPLYLWCNPGMKSWLIAYLPLA